MGRKAKTEAEQAKRPDDERPEQESAERGEWGDEVAHKARTADDPLAMAPHDRAGRPSQGRPI
ncbi:hypothetical protein AB0J86_19410 [Micromonospora sp. NPDC049559]|uniref:hypothetical protein n=1 Tax=Micromonospora sp. NPDC049559 TaxID=3155923 RepID=UPI0034262687